MEQSNGKSNNSKATIFSPRTTPLAENDPSLNPKGDDGSPFSFSKHILNIYEKYQYDQVWMKCRDEVPRVFDLRKEILATMNVHFLDRFRSPTSGEFTILGVGQDGGLWVNFDIEQNPKCIASRFRSDSCILNGKFDLVNKGGMIPIKIGDKGYEISQKLCSDLCFAFGQFPPKVK